MPIVPILIALGIFLLAPDEVEKKPAKTPPKKDKETGDDDE